MTIQKLNSLLSNVPAGAIPASIRDELLKLIVASWNEFSGTAETSMGAWKISRDAGPKGDRLEPALFVIRYRTPWGDGTWLDPRREATVDSKS